MPYSISHASGCFDIEWTAHISLISSSRTWYRKQSHSYSSLKGSPASHKQLFSFCLNFSYQILVQINCTIIPTDQSYHNYFKNEQQRLVFLTPGKDTTRNLLAILSTLSCSLTYKIKPWAPQLMSETLTAFILSAHSSALG